MFESVSGGKDKPIPKLGKKGLFIVAKLETGNGLSQGRQAWPPPMRKSKGASDGLPSPPPGIQLLPIRLGWLGRCLGDNSLCYVP